MAPHANFLAVYPRRFWREAGLSGGAQSLVGPMTEIHDATSSAGEAALFGFDDAPASNTLDSHVSRLRRRLSDAGAGVAIHALRGVGYMAKAE